MGRRWRLGIADIAFVSMEALSTFVIAAMVAGIGGHSGPALPTMVLAALGGFLLARGLLLFDLPRRSLLTIALLLSAGSIWLLASLDAAIAGSAAGPIDVVSGGTTSVAALDIRWTQIAGLAFVAIAWVRGGAGGARTMLNQRIVFSSLTIGLAVLAVGLTFGRASVSSRDIDQAAIPFLAAGLLSLAVLNLNRAEHIRGDSWRGPWLLVVGGTIAVLLALAALSGMLPLSSFDTVLRPLVFLLFVFIDALIYLVALPTVLLLNWLLSHLLSGHLHPIQMPVPPAAAAAQQLHGQAHHGGLVLALLAIAHFLLVAGFIAAVVAALWWAYSRLHQPPPDTEISRERLEHERGLGEDINGALQRLLGRLRMRSVQDEPALPPRLRALRKLYLRLLDSAAAAGSRKPPGVTPREFGPALRQRFAEPAAESLSNAFSAGRYGRIEPSEETLHSLARRLRQLAPQSEDSAQLPGSTRQA